EKIVEVTCLSAGLRLEVSPPERASVGLEFGARIVVSALGLNRECAAQGVEPEHGIGARYERHGGDRRFRNQVPVDGVAEGLVQAHAVHIDRQALRRAEQGRGRESVVIDVQLKGIVGAFVDVDAAEVVVEIIGNAQGLLALQVRRVRGLHVRGDLVQRQSESGQGGVGDYGDLGQFAGGGGIVGRLRAVSVVRRGRARHRGHRNAECAQRRSQSRMRHRFIILECPRASVSANRCPWTIEKLPVGAGNNSRPGRMGIDRERGRAMRESPMESPPTPPVRAVAWRDVAIVAGVTVLAFVLSAHFQFTEALYALTRHWEYFQVDELPVGMFALSLGLIWLSWKRYRDADRELEARRIAEARLEAVLSENRRLAQENLRIQEVERKHLARELHDELGQYLNAIKLDAVSIRAGGVPVAGLYRDASQSIIRAVDHVHVAVSGMIGRLRPVGLDELGLVAA